MDSTLGSALRSMAVAMGRGPPVKRGEEGKVRDYIDT